MLGFRQTSVHVFYFWFIRLHLPRRMNLFSFPPPPTAAPESAHRAHRQVRENRPIARAPQTITPTAAPKIGHRARALPHAQSKIGPPEHDRRNHRPKPPTFASSKPHKITHLRGLRKPRAAIHTANPPFHTTPLQKFCPSPAPAYFCIVIKTATKYKSKNRRQ